jgi:hypothetical protein
MVALCYLAPWLLVWVGRMASSPRYRATQTSHGWAGAFLSATGHLWLTAVVALCVITMVFAVLERSRFLEDWSPRKLPPVRDTNRIARSSSLIEIGVNIVFGLWWISAASSRFVQDRIGPHVYSSAPWSIVFWGFLLLAMANLAVSSANLLHPYWTAVRAGFRLATDAAGAGLICWLIRSDLPLQLSISRASPGRVSAINEAVHPAMEAAFAAAVIVGVLVVLAGLRRIVRAAAGAGKPLSARS